MSEVWSQLPSAPNAPGAVVGSGQLTLRLCTPVSHELELYAGDMTGVQGPWVTGGQQQLHPAQFQIPGECTWFCGLW